MTTNDALSPRPRRGLLAWLPPALQFSIRELLLLTALVASLIALAVAYYQNYERSRSFQPTNVPGQINREMAWDLTRRFLGHDPPRYYESYGDEARSELVRYHTFSIQLPAERRAEFMERLLGEVQNRIKDADADQRPAARGTSDGRVDTFIIEYEKVRTRGKIWANWVNRFETDARMMVILIVVHEYQVMP